MHKLIITFSTRKELYYGYETNLSYYFHFFLALVACSDDNPQTPNDNPTSSSSATDVPGLSSTGDIPPLSSASDIPGLSSITDPAVITTPHRDSS